MATDPLVTVQRNWTRRIAMAPQLGLDANHLRQVANQDLNAVKSGGKPMTRDQAWVSVQALQSGGANPLTKESGTRPIDLPGNAVRDVGSILWNFPKGMAHMVTHAPEDIGSLFGDLLHGHLPTDPKAQEGALALGSALEFVPGLDILGTGILAGTGALDVAHKASSKPGRDEILRHPVGSLLELLPLAKGATSEVAKAAGVGVEEEASVAAKAAAEGKPLKAALNAIPGYTEKRAELLQRAGIDPEALTVRRGFAAIKRQTQLALNGRLKDISKMFDGIMSHDEMVRFHEIVTRPDLHPTETLTELDKARLALYEQHTNHVRGVLDSYGMVHTPFAFNGHDIVYANEGAGRQVGALYDRMNRRATRANEAVQTLKDTIAKHGPDAPITKVKARAAQRRWNEHIQVGTQFLRKFRDTVPAQYVPMVEGELKATMEAVINDRYAGSPMLDQALKDFETQGNMGAYFGTQENFNKIFNQIRNEAQRSWVNLAREDARPPLWMHQVDEARASRGFQPVRIGTKISTPGVAKNVALDLGPSSHNVGMAISDAERQALQLQGSEQAILTYLVPHARPVDDVRAELLPVAEKRAASEPFTSPAGQLRSMISEQYVELNDALTGGLTSPKLSAVYQQKLLIPRYIAEAAQDYFNPANHSSAFRIVRGGNRVFITSVIAFSPTHLMHIFLGGMMTKLLTAGGLEDFRPGMILDAIRMAKDPTTMPLGVSNTLDDYTPEDMMAYLRGKHTARMLLEHVGNAANFVRNLSEHGQNFYRAWSYLAEKAKWEKAGVPTAEADARALSLVNKIYVDINGMTPIERDSFKLVFPFYPVTKAFLHTILSYPIDHPVRASIIANVGEIEAKDNVAHGLSNNMAAMFFFGVPDLKGDQWGMNLRAVNPYRDQASNFTLAGFFRNLTPLVQGPLRAGGFNPLDGQADPYNQLAIDPNTGQLTTKTPGGGLQLAEAFVPELGTVDHFLGLSGQMRRLKQTNPQAFRKQLFQTLNIPFVPQQTNLPQLQAAAARRSLRVEQQDVSASWKSLSPISGYQTITVPSTIKRLFGGRTLVSPQEWNTTISELARLKKEGVRRVAGISLP